MEKISGLGIANHIFLVQEKRTRQSVVLKHGTDSFAHKAAQHLSSNLARQELEYNCLKLMEQLYPGGAPRPYAIDKELHIIAMEYVEGGTLLTATTHGDIDVKLAERLGSQIGRLTYKTHREVVSKQEWQHYQRILANKQSLQTVIDFMTSAVEDLDVYDESHAELYKVENKEQFIHMQREIRELKLYDRVRELYTRQDCFGNIDLHGHSVLIANDRCAFIDYEYGGLTSHALPLGKVMTAYYTALYDERNKNPAKHELLKTCLHAIVEAFLRSLDDLSIIGPLDVFFNELALAFSHFIFSVCTVASDVVAPWFTGTEDDKSIMREKSFYLLKNYHEITSIDKFSHVLFD